MMAEGKAHTLEARNLQVGYDGKTVIENLSLSIPAGKFSVIIGGNGCGKSTFLKALCRLNPPMHGDILLDGKSVGSYRAAEFARILGMLPQSPIVPDGISVIDLVSRGRFPYRTTFGGLKKSDYAAIEDAMKTMGITELADRNVDALSGGQRQRVWIALALAQETDILLLDEPTTYLDISYQIEILELLVRLNRERGTTIVMVHHDINQAARYADVIFAMKNGRLTAQGAPEKILTEDLIRDVFGMKCEVIQDPVYGSPAVIPVGHPEIIRREKQ